MSIFCYKLYAHLQAGVSMGALYYVPIIHDMGFGSMMLYAIHNGKDALAKQLKEVDDFEIMLQARIPEFLVNSGQNLSKLCIKVDGLVDM